MSWLSWFLGGDIEQPTERTLLDAPESKFAPDRRRFIRGLAAAPAAIVAADAVAAPEPRVVEKIVYVREPESILAHPSRFGRSMATAGYAVTAVDWSDISTTYRMGIAAQKRQT